jgi:hypothetical protein
MSMMQAARPKRLDKTGSACSKRMGVRDFSHGERWRLSFGGAQQAG